MSAMHTSVLPKTPQSTRNFQESCPRPRYAYPQAFYPRTTRLPVLPGKLRSAPRTHFRQVHVKSQTQIESTLERDRKVAQRSKPVDFLYNAQGKVWRVRPYDCNDYPTLVQLQAESFYVEPSLKLFAPFTRQAFRAEVIDALRQKERQKDASRFVMLVAEDVSAWAEEALGGDSGWTKEELHTVSPAMYCMPVTHVQSPPAISHQGVLGVVEVTMMDEREVLGSLALATREYAYISSMAVAPPARRQGLASVLMAAAARQCVRWQEPQVALFVYEDNEAAVALYQKLGMRTLKKDPSWKKMVGGRVRLLMYRNLEEAIQRQAQQLDGVEEDAENVSPRVDASSS